MTWAEGTVPMKGIVEVIPSGNRHYVNIAATAAEQYTETEAVLSAILESVRLLE